MTTNGRPPNADAHDRARQAFHSLTREQKLARMRRAGVIGETPALGDKVCVRDPFGARHFAVVVGVRQDTGEVTVVRNVGALVALATLGEFSGGGVVELVQRASPGHEQAAAQYALALVGKQFDVARFEHPAPTASSGLGAMLAVAAAAFGLAVAADAFRRDRAWDENTARYRDGRGRFAR